MPIFPFRPATSSGNRPHIARIAAISLLFAATSALAQIYTWKDENGRTVMSDKPPVGKVQQKRVIDTPPAGSVQTPPPKSLAEKEMEFRQQQKIRQDKAKEAEEEAAQQKKRKDNCDAARRNLALYQSGERIARRNDAGEREILDDGQRAAEAAKAQQAVNEWCK